MQHTLKTESGEYLVVDVPEGARNIRIDNTMAVIFYETNSSPYNHISINDYFIPFDYEIIGIYPGLTEHEAMEIVDRAFDPDYWENYHKSTHCESALESFASLLEANRIYEVNPLGKDPRVFYHGEQNEGPEVLMEWQEAEDRTSKYKLILKKL